MFRLIEITKDVVPEGNAIYFGSNRKYDIYIKFFENKKLTRWSYGVEYELTSKEIRTKNVNTFIDQCIEVSANEDFKARSSIFHVGVLPIINQ